MLHEALAWCLSQSKFELSVIEPTAKFEFCLHPVKDLEREKSEIMIIKPYIRSSLRSWLLGTKPLVVDSPARELRTASGGGVTGA